VVNMNFQINPSRPADRILRAMIPWSPDNFFPGRTRPWHGKVDTFVARNTSGGGC
jgi:hypothetical protein